MKLAFAIDLWVSGVFARTMSVSTVPGASALTRIPRGAKSAAIAHVRGHRERVATAPDTAQVRFRIPACLRLPATDDDLGAAAQESFGNGATDAACPAGHDRDAIAYVEQRFECHHVHRATLLSPG